MVFSEAYPPPTDDYQYGYFDDTEASSGFGSGLTPDDHDATPETIEPHGTPPPP